MARKFSFDGEQMCLTADSTEGTIAIGYEDGYVQLWDTRSDDRNPILTGRCSAGSPDGAETFDDVSSVVFGNKAKHNLHISAGCRLYLQDIRKVVESKWKVPQLDVNGDDINQIAISDNDEVLASAEDSGEIVLIDLRNSRLLTRLKKHKNVVYTVQFRPGKPRELISGGYDCVLVHWDILKSRVLSSTDLSNAADSKWNLPKSFNPSYVLSCSFAELTPGVTKTGVLTVGTENGNLHCLHCDKNVRPYRSFKAHQLGVTQTKYLRCYSQSGPVNTLVTGGNDGRIMYWNVNELFSDIEEGESGGCKAIHTVDHGDKINWISECQDKYILVCDTTSEATLLPIPP